jgi:hypothetical protein
MSSRIRAIAFLTFFIKKDISKLIARVKFIFLFGLDFSGILIDRCSCNLKSNLQMLTAYISLRL